MKRKIRIYNIEHAVECIFYDNLENKFAELWEVWLDGENMNDVIKRYDITTDDLIHFLNGHSDRCKYEKVEEWEM